MRTHKHYKVRETQTQKTVTPLTRLFGACGASGLASIMITTRLALEARQALSTYTEAKIDRLAKSIRLKNPWKVVIDTGNGATEAVEKLVKETRK